MNDPPFFALLLCEQRQNQISFILTDLQCIVGNMSQVPGSVRTIIVQLGGGAIAKNFTLNAPRIGQHGGYLIVSIVLRFLDDSGSAGSVASVSEAFLIFLESLAEPIIPFTAYSKCLEACNNFMLCKQVGQRQTPLIGS